MHERDGVHSFYLITCSKDVLHVNSTIGTRVEASHELSHPEVQNGSVAKVVSPLEPQTNRGTRISHIRSQVYETVYEGLTQERSIHPEVVLCR